MKQSLGYAKERILKNARCIDENCIVYFLIDDEEIVYVGQSKNGTSRIADHAKDTDKEFDKFFYIDIPEKKLDMVEAFYIYEFKPKYNKQIPQSYLLRYTYIDCVVENLKKKGLYAEEYFEEILNEEDIFVYPLSIEGKILYENEDNESLYFVRSAIFGSDKDKLEERLSSEFSTIEKIRNKIVYLKEEISDANNFYKVNQLIHERSSLNALYRNYNFLKKLSQRYVEYSLLERIFAKRGVPSEYFWAYESEVEPGKYMIKLHLDFILEGRSIKDHEVITDF